ncbi:uncharacterized protein C14orf119-like [Haliotis rufescens]|uniref:uncharacterized protein C14orf119-like n=1 Tax=Haliotis rufescens TaxID=6454 RepID=UPI001EAF9FA7|nr:uncharacterized protein C14orf119-like [Haliotis rufescens]
MSTSCVEKEIQTVAHWFQCWSPMQKEDFYKDLVEKAAPPQVDALFDAMKTLNVQDRPPSIFQCQLKLFNQWFGGWTQQDRNSFVIKLAEVDALFVQRFNEEVASLQGSS